MQGSFQGKVAAVTGAGSGIGRALAQALAKRGCALALSDVDEKGLAQTAESLPNARVTVHRVDVADRAQVQAWADAAAREHGRVNLAFNNAGIAYAATVQGAEEAEFRRLMDVNFWGVVHGTQAFLPHLEASGDGHVVNVSSLFGLVAFPGQCAYSAAKFAVRGYTETLQVELSLTGSKVRATCVHPGGVRTNIVKASKGHASLSALGVDVETAGADFERTFRSSPEQAAGTILRGVQKNARRVLVGDEAVLLDFVQRLLPGAYHGLVARVSRRMLRRRRAA